jgi:membrane-anchored protein YejM (alkaline phosphatase superfamily)
MQAVSSRFAPLFCGVLCACAPPSDSFAPAEATQPDLLVIVLDTTTPDAVAEAMPNTAAFLADNLSWDLAISPANATTEAVGGLFQGRFLETSDLTPGEASTAEVTLAERLGAAGYSTLLVSSNSVLDLELFGRGFQHVAVEPRGAAHAGTDA